MSSRHAVCALVALLCAVVVSRADETTNAAPLAVMLTLSDGSQVRGIPALRELPVKTSYASLQLPFANIRDITFGADQAVTVVLANGDRLSAAITVKELQVTALFGRITVPVALLKRLVVHASGTVAPLQGLVLWYDFRNVVEGKVRDESGRGHDGRLFGDATIVDDPERGRALALDGAAAHIRVPGSPDFHLSNCTVAVWVKRESWDIPRDTGEPIFCTGTPTGREGGILMGLAPGCLLGWAYRPASDRPGIGANAPLKLEADDQQWHLLALTIEFQDGASLMRAYQDGQLLSESTATSALPNYSNQILYIGINYDSPAAERGMDYPRQFKGQLADYRVFDRALSAAEIAALQRAAPRPSAR